MLGLREAIPFNSNDLQGFAGDGAGHCLSMVTGVPDKVSPKTLGFACVNCSMVTLSVSSHRLLSFRMKKSTDIAAEESATDTTVHIGSANTSKYCESVTCK